MALIIISVISLILLIILIASFIGNEENNSPIWRSIFKIRKIMDTISYALFNLIAFTGIIKAMIYIFNSHSDNIINESFKLLGIVMLLFILIYSINRLIKEEFKNPH